MTNIQKALELISTFASGDTKKAKSLLAEGYIQHNLAYGTGRDAFAGSVSYLASAPVKTTVNNIRAFEDGDKVFLQTVYNFTGAGEQVAFDIFRFDEDGLIAELDLCQYLGQKNESSVWRRGELHTAFHISMSFCSNVIGYVAGRSAEMWNCRRPHYQYARYIGRF